MERCDTPHNQINAYLQGKDLDGRRSGVPGSLKLTQMHLHNFVCPALFGEKIRMFIVWILVF